jgi:hypothetical protein
MAQYEGSYQRQEVRSTGAGEISGWAIGFTLFASMLMILMGSFHFISGFVAILDDTFYVVRPGYDLEVDVSTWGWIHMIGGIVVAVAGVGLLTGNLAARIVAVGVALLSAIWNFFSIPYYPVWSIVQIAVAVGVIWALTVHGGDFSQET